MKKKTLILTKDQIDEICGGAYGYLHNLDSDLSPNNETSVEGSLTNDSGKQIFPKNTKTDDISGEMTPELQRLSISHGKGNSKIYEMSKKDWEKKRLYNEAKLMHGNKRFKNRKFGDSNGQYDESELNQQNYRYREALKDSRSADPEKQAKGAKSLQRMANNRAKDGKTTALRQYNSAKKADKIIQGSKPEGTKIKSVPKQTGNGKGHSTKNGIITLC